MYLESGIDEEAGQVLEGGELVVEGDTEGGVEVDRDRAIEVQEGVRVVVHVVEPLVDLAHVPGTAKSEKRSGWNAKKSGTGNDVACRQ